MSQSASHTDRPIPVTCRICGTRLYASMDQVGKPIQCPDCHGLTVVSAPPPEKAPFRPAYTGDEYRLQDEEPRAKSAAPDNLVRVVCGTCFTLMHARPEHVGKKIRCPDCNSLTVIPRPKAPLPPRPPVDVSDVHLEEAREASIDESRKQTAERLLAEAHAHLEEKRDDRPPPPKYPLRENIYGFPFHWTVMPLWIGASAGALVNLYLFQVLVDVINAGGFASIMAAFLVPIFSISCFGLIALVMPHFLTIIEFTADGYNSIPHWPSEDFLSRLRAVILAVNALAMSTMPGMLLIWPLQSLGVPLWPGFISTVLLLPLVLLSMLENNSVFVPYSRFVFGSLRKVPLAWQLFYVQILMLAALLLAVDYAVWMFDATVSSIVTTFTVMIYAVLYTRLLGRMAYVLGQLEVEDEDEDEDEGQGQAGGEAEDRLPDDESFRGGSPMLGRPRST